MEVISGQLIVSLHVSHSQCELILSNNVEMVMIELEDIFLRLCAPEASISKIKLLVTCCFPETVCIQVTALHNGD